MAYTANRELLVRAVMECSTGLPEDRVINDFAFHLGADVTPTIADDMMGLVDDFYRTYDNGSNGKVGEYISNYVNRSATHLLQAYKIVTGPLGSPYAESDWLGPVTASEATGLPSEVAAVLSFHANLTGVQEESGSTRPRARRRGRIYLGPLVPGCIVSGTPPYRLGTGVQSALRFAAAELRDAASEYGAGYYWAVWSRADETLRQITGGWTDNAPDTQRRRGPAASTRVVWGS